MPPVGQGGSRKPVRKLVACATKVIPIIGKFLGLRLFEQHIIL